MFLRKGVLKKCSKFTAVHPCRSAISIKLPCNCIEITLRHGCSPVNFLLIFRTSLPKNTPERLLLTFVPLILLSLTLASDTTVVYGNNAFSILVFSTKNGTAVLWKRFSFYRKFVSKLKYLFQSIENVQNCQWLSHKNKPISQMQHYFENSPVPVFGRAYALSVDFKMKSLEKGRFPVLRQKLTQIWP